jgi:ATP-dependent HslUV protease ATP-binding subunit HslU
MRREIMPKNILMIGPTGVGKTEIARRLAAVRNAPFLKVEATKFTEVGYVGRDVESIIHDLVEVSAIKIYHEKLKGIENKAEKLATERILNYLCQQWVQRGRQLARSYQSLGAVSKAAKETSGQARSKRISAETRQQVAELLRNKKLEEQFIEIELDNELDGMVPLVESSLEMDLEDLGNSFNEFYRDFKGYAGQQLKRKVRVKEARRILSREEANKLVDFSQVLEQATEQVEENAVVFIDELDKIVGPRIDMGRDVSGEGVQRDLLPIVEGTTVMTRYGSIKTEHILFIAAGTFSQSKPSDLIPELQGRFPLRVELNPLSQQDLERILLEPRNALTKQYQSLLTTDGVELVFSEDGIHEIARLAALMNERMENIGARRLYTIM